MNLVNLGNHKKVYMTKLKNGLDQYIDILREPGGLISQTYKYINSQKDLLMKDARGYTATDSIRARREGNQNG